MWKKSWNNFLNYEPIMQKAVTVLVTASQVQSIRWQAFCPAMALHLFLSEATLQPIPIKGHLRSIEVIQVLWHHTSLSNLLEWCILLNWPKLF